jgi:signal transduction histidine kinase
MNDSFSCRLCWSVATGVFFAILVVEAAILLFSVNNYERDRLAELERESLVVARSIVRSFDVLENSGVSLADVGEGLRINSVLIGAEFYDEAGTKISGFGELPDMSFGGASDSETMNRKITMPYARLDLYWTPSQLKEPYFVSARIDTSEIGAQVNAFIWRIIGLVLLISVFVTVVTMVVLERMVLSPIRDLRDGLLVAGSDSDHSVKHLLPAVRSDELGEVIQAFNQMIQQTGKNFGQIKKQGKELAKHRDQLELLVSKRTAKLEVAKKNAEAANKAKSQFMAHMSHELRTPLNAIIGFSQMWIDQVMGPIKNPTYIEYANDINKSGSQLLQIISGILDLTKIEDGDTDIELSEIDLNNTLADCLSEFEYDISLKSLKLSTNVASELSVFRADQKLLNQIINNIVGNAVKFTKQDGHININAYLVEDGSISIKISDTGVGIQTKDLAMVLEPFGQARDSAHVAHEGTGLGLPLAKRLTELHGGTLEISSEFGRGTTVSTTFPFKDESIARCG